MTVEAVNSVLQNASVIRASADQASTADSSGNPDRVQKAAQGPYVSPYVTFSSGIAIVEIRNTQTGTITEEIPTPPRTSADSEGNSSPPPVASAQQVAAFAAAAQSGNTNAGNVNLIA